MDCPPLGRVLEVIMNDLTPNDLKEKIKTVEEDIDTLRRAGQAGRRLDVLCEYKEYLETELLQLINENNRNT